MYFYRCGDGWKEYGCVSQIRERRLYLHVLQRKKNTKHISRVALVTIVGRLIECVPLSEKCLHALLLLSFTDHSSANVGKIHSHVTWFVNRKLKRPILGAVWSYLSSLLAKTMPCFPRGSDQNNSQCYFLKKIQKTADQNFLFIVSKHDSKWHWVKVNLNCS